ncbi:hypothetical protein [Actinacidiphila sp. ITFR-21]|uniref:hypothetical protein n=1 Tax=Actinacidiphila sp. ITFR-21 TaxID=3075199 RepID=UPI00288B5F4B|nr:hypothetical protein [Streptomyces sp. ITFR-21]WNI14471.1 hypothetical protein RLT57_02210 [Streptomyces sp. ITFR-21]
MSPIASAAARTGPGRRTAATAASALLVLSVLLGDLLSASSARAEPLGHRAWIYEFTDFTALPAATDYDHRTVTLTGLLTRRHRQDGPAQPAPAQTVDLVQSPDGSAAGTAADPSGGSGTPGGGSVLGRVTTDTQGRFLLEDVEIGLRPGGTGAAAPGPHTVVVRAVHPAVDTVGADEAAEARVEVTATASTARLAVDYRLGAVTAAGRTVTATGSYARDSAAGPQPLTGVPVRVQYRPVDGTPLVRETLTGYDGNFSVVFTATSNGVVSAAPDGPPDPYLVPAGPDGTELPVPVPPPSASPSPTPVATEVRLATVPARQMITTTRPTRSPAPRTASPAAAPKAVQPADTPPRLAATGDGTPRIAFLTGGSTLLAAGLLLMVVRRRIRAAG